MVRGGCPGVRGWCWGARARWAPGSLDSAARMPGYPCRPLFPRSPWDVFAKLNGDLSCRLRAGRPSLGPPGEPACASPPGAHRWAQVPEPGLGRSRLTRPSEGVLVWGTDGGLRLNPGPGLASPTLPREVSWAGGDLSSLPAPSITAGSLLGSGTSEENKENDLRPPLPQSYAATVARPSASAASTVPGERAAGPGWSRGLGGHGAGWADPGAWVVTVPGGWARDLGLRSAPPASLTPHCLLQVTPRTAGRSAGRSFPNTSLQRDRFVWTTRMSSLL